MPFMVNHGIFEILIGCLHCKIVIYFLLIGRNSYFVKYRIIWLTLFFRFYIRTVQNVDHFVKYRYIICKAVDNLAKSFVYKKLPLNPVLVFI